MTFIQIFKDKKFYRTMLRLAVPIALQNLILSSLNLVDTIMIRNLGEDAIAGVDLANQYFFLLSLLLFGINSGSSIFTAQYWGNRDTKFGLLLDAGAVWFVGVPLAFLGGLVWNLPIYWVYVLVHMEEVYKII